jgi:glycosyltransferase involved in cell wall biosynthesis
MELIAQGSGIKEGAGGAVGYFHGIVPPLRDDPRVTELVLYVPSWYERADEWAGPKVRIVRCRVAESRPLRVAYEHVALPLHAARDRLDVLFSPGNYRPLAYRGTNVLGLHAIQQFIYPDQIGTFRDKYLRFTVPRSVRTAALTITSTDTLRDDAIRLFSVDPERIVTVPMGPTPWVEELLAADDGDRPDPYRTADGAPYAMCISRLYGLKNHRRLIEAYARLVSERDVPHRLLIVGGDADVTGAELAEVAAAAGVADRVTIMGRVEQDLVPRLYAGAAAIVYPSLYETFGHPVLEALATETPLLTSSNGATAEVAGGAARLVDPESVEDITRGLEDVLFDEDLRARLMCAGPVRAREFSWDRCARGTVDVLERAVQARRAA